MKRDKCWASLHQALLPGRCVTLGIWTAVASTLKRRYFHRKPDDPRGLAIHVLQGPVLTISQTGVAGGSQLTTTPSLELTRLACFSICMLIKVQSILTQSPALRAPRFSHTAPRVHCTRIGEESWVFIANYISLVGRGS